MRASPGYAPVEVGVSRNWARLWLCGSGAMVRLEDGRGITLAQAIASHSINKRALAAGQSRGLLCLSGRDFGKLEQPPGQLKA